MLGFPTLATRCLTLLCQQNRNLEQSHPDFYSVFSASNEGAQQSVALQELQKQPAGEIAKLPFFEGASEAYLALLCNASKELLNNGSENVYLTLLDAFQHINLPESISVKVKLLLVQFLEKKGATAKVILEGVCDNDQMVAHALKALKNLLIETAETVESQIQLIRNAHRFLNEEGTIRSRRTSNIFDLWQEQIDTIFEGIQQIYSYLKNNVDSIDEQLLDDAVEFAIKNKLQTANNICQIMIDSTESAPNLEAQYLQKILHTHHARVTGEFAKYLIDKAGVGRPKTAYYLVERYYAVDRNAPGVNEEKLLEYLYIAAVQKYKPAIDELNRLAKNNNFFEAIAPLGDPDHIIGLDEKKWEKEVKQIAEKLVRAIRFFNEAWPLWRAQNSKFNIHIKATFEERMEIGKLWLLSNQRSFRRGYEHNDVFNGVEILEPLSKLDHPLAPEAKQVLNKWLSDTNNKVWLIKQYSVAASHFYRRCGEYQHHKERCTEHVDFLLNQVRELKTQNDTDTANKLIYALIDTAIGLENTGALNQDECFFSYFYGLLISSNALDGNCLKEVAARKNFCDSKQAFALENLSRGDKLEIEAENLECFINAAETKGRRSPAYQLGKWYRDGSWGIEENFNEAIYYFQKAAKEGCEKSKTEFDSLVERQVTYLSESSLEKDGADLVKLGLMLHEENPEKAKLLFVQAAQKGNEQAKNFLNLHSTPKENCSIQ